MAEQSQHRISRPAHVDLSAKQYYFSVSNGGEADLPAGDGVPCLGVIQNDPKQGEGAAICDGGRTFVIADGSVAQDATVSAKAGGKAKAAAAGEYIQGIALTGDGGVDGARIEIHYNPQGRHA